MFVCLLHICLVYRLALLGHTNLLPLLDCPTSVPWLLGVVDPPAAVSDRFKFPPIRRAAPRPRPPLAQPIRLVHPLLQVGIWSMKEFCNLNYDAGDVFEEIFH